MGVEYNWGGGVYLDRYCVRGCEVDEKVLMGFSRPLSCYRVQEGGLR